MTNPGYLKHNNIDAYKLSNYSTSDILPPGVYDVRTDMDSELVFLVSPVKTDNLIKMPKGPTLLIISRIQKFLEKETQDRYKKYGFTHRYGILMHGRAGTGKTSTIMQLMSEVVNLGGIVLVDSHDARQIKKALTGIRARQPNVPVLVVFEEFEGMCGSPDFKALLDGAVQFDNVVYLATTNYIDSVPETFKNRPSRFALVLEIGAPTAYLRRAYLKNKLVGETKEYIETWVKLTAGLVLDQIKDVVCSVKCLDISLADAVKKIKGMETTPVKAPKDDDEDDDEEYSSPTPISDSVYKSIAKSLKKQRDNYDETSE